MSLLTQLETKYLLSYNFNVHGKLRALSNIVSFKGIMRSIISQEEKLNFDRINHLALSIRSRSLVVLYFVPIWSLAHSQSFYTFMYTLISYCIHLN